MSDEELPHKKAANALAEAIGADVMLVNARISRALDQTVLDLCRKRERRPNILLLLVTEGGDPDAAYRIAQSFHNHYKKLTLLVSGYCKSAGTLVALGANELVIADSGELGPVDIQMSKPDELLQTQSGLTATAALNTLNDEAFQAFENFLLQLVARSGTAISTKMATQIATQLACGLFSPLYAHIDPMHVGEAGRALVIAQKYGQMLQKRVNSLKVGALAELMTGYPSHGFVIDRHEAKRLFTNVRPPTAGEQTLIDTLRMAAVEPVSGADNRIVAFLSDEIPTQQKLELVTGGVKNGDVESKSIEDGAPVVGGDPERESGAPSEPVAAGGEGADPRPASGRVGKSA